jgi:hypothetical protein
VPLWRIADAGLGRAVVSDVPGRASIAITKDVYGHLLEGDKRAAAELITRALSSDSSSPVAPSVAPTGTRKALPDEERAR